MFLEKKSDQRNGKRLGLEREQKFLPRGECADAPSRCGRIHDIVGGPQGGSRLTSAGDQECDENDNFFQAATWLVIFLNSICEKLKGCILKNTLKSFSQLYWNCKAPKNFMGMIPLAEDQKLL